MALKKKYPEVYVLVTIVIHGDGAEIPGGKIKQKLFRTKEEAIEAFKQSEAIATQMPKVVTLCDINKLDK